MRRVAAMEQVSDTGTRKERDSQRQGVSKGRIL